MLDALWRHPELGQRVLDATSWGKRPTLVLLEECLEQRNAHEGAQPSALGGFRVIRLENVVRPWGESNRPSRTHDQPE